MATYNRDAERQVLGIAISAKGRAYDLVESLCEDDFTTSAHREIYRAVRIIAERGDAPDMVIVHEEIEKFGGEADFLYIADLANCFAGAAVMDDLMAIIREKSERRKLDGLLRATHTKLTDMSEDVEDIKNSLVAELIKGRESRTDIKPLRQAYTEAYGDISAAVAAKNEKRLLGIRSGFPWIDEKTSGFKKGELIVIAARSSMGKTALALNIANHAQREAPVLFFSLEMKAEHLAMRLMSQETGVPMHAMRAGSVDEFDVMLLGDCLKKAGDKFYISDRFSQTPGDIIATSQSVKHKYGLGLVVIDYLQLMKRTEYKDNEVQAIDAIMRGLKVAAGELDVPVIILSQLSREADKGDREPRLSDLRGSGGIEQNADVVMLLHKQSRKATDADLILAKQRNGMTGKVKLYWDGEHTKFSEMAVREA